MQPPTSARFAGQIFPSQDLPYGRLPVRGESTNGPSERPPLEQLVDVSWLALGDAPPPEPAVAGADRVRGEASGPPTSAAGLADADADADEVAAKDLGERAADLSLTNPRPQTDDDVRLGVAARALGVSRETMERMVKRGHLERGPSNAPATVSKRALVATLETRRRGGSDLTRATEIEHSQSPDQHLSRSPGAAAAALTELGPILAPLLDDFVAAQTRAAVLEKELERLRARAGQDRARDELLVAPTAKGWWGRRKTRQAVLRQSVLDEHSGSGSASG